MRIEKAGKEGEKKRKRRGKRAP